MFTPITLLTTALLATLPNGLPANAGSSPHSKGWGIRHQDFAEVVSQVEQMPFNQDLQTRTNRYGLTVVNVMWEDTGRYEGSAVGPNISDLTLQVRREVNGGIQTHLLPVIRHPNYTDKTGDVPADKLWVRVGNQKSGGELVAVPLTEVLKNLREYMSSPDELKGSDNFLAKRDSHFLVSAQHVFLPIPSAGKVEFNPVLYNYQSYPGSPAVLTLLVTREGTSIRIIENNSGDQSYQGWGQQLFFNKAGQRTAFTAERKSTVKARIEAGQAREGDEGAMDPGADMMMIVQIPLKQAARSRGGWFDDLGAAMPMGEAEMAPAAPSAKSAMGAMDRQRSDVEQAVLGHGKELGKFAEINGLKIERDDRFPIRVTVQFYKATSNGVVSDSDLQEVASTIEKVYQSADYVGSLVVPENDRPRPTQWTKPVRPRISFWW